jgi:predicted ABC-type ATPase
VKEIVLIGGPNGAGKTSTARELLPVFFAACEYLNADEIARNISPENVDSAAFAAGRVLIERMRWLVSRSQCFALETTCSGKSYISLLRECRKQGWRISLLYLWLNTPEASLLRVKKRVAAGGHSIPAEAIQRRFRSGVANMLNLYLPLAHEAEIYDNTNRNRILVAEKRNDGNVLVHDPAVWNLMKEAAR